MPVFSGDYSISLSTREGFTTAGVDLVSMGCTPRRKGVGVDVCLDDDFAFSDASLAKLLDLVVPLSEGRREIVTIGKKRFAAVVVRFLVTCPP